MTCEIDTSESSAGGIAWLPIPDAESQYPKPLPENIKSQNDPPVVTAASQEDEPFAILGNSGGCVWVYGFIPLAYIPLFFVRK